MIVQRLFGLTVAGISSFLRFQSALLAYTLALE